MESLNHPVLYEVNYDLECTEFVFKKGDKFAASILGGVEMLLDAGGFISSTFATLPESTLGLHVYTTPGGVMNLYAIINPDGNFTSDYQFAGDHADSSGVPKLWSRYHNVCDLKNGEPLFKQVDNKGL